MLSPDITSGSMVADPGAPDAKDAAGDAPRRPRGRRRPGLPGSLLAQGLVLVMAAAAWWLASVAEPGHTIASPAASLAALSRLSGQRPFWGAVGDTALTWAISMAICMVVGIPGGLAIGLSRAATRSTRLLIDFIRTIPPVALVPLFLLLDGPTQRMVIFLAVSGAVWPLIVQGVYAARQTEPQLREMARSFRLTRSARLRYVYVPSVLPFVMTGLRVTATICLLLTITGELLGGAPGVGTQIENALNKVDNPAMYAYVLTAALLGLAVNGGFRVAQHRVLRWHPSVRGEQR